jgi:branched-chain amino acid transport system ATP-binding protein
VRDCLEAAYELFPILRERRVQLAGTLSGGQQKMLSLARGLALRPKLLMVDEPTEGLMPANVALTAAALAKATQLGVAVLVVDASFDLIAETCSRLYAMDRGVLTGMFRPSEFSGPDELAARYLGAVNA